jgi:hypothetical protein
MKVYLDANIFKFSATKLLRFFPRDQEVNWGGQTITTKVHDIGYLNPNDGITNPELKAEVDLLPTVAELAKSKKIIAVCQVETWFETWRMKNMDSEGGKFYGAEVGECKPPFEYGRIVAGVGVDFRRAQLDFIASISNHRFLEIQKVVGAHQGPNKKNPNQLLDAFAIWCAETNGCDAFLSLDFSLAQVVARDKKRRVGLQILRPSELISVVAKNA